MSIENARISRTTFDLSVNLDSHAGATVQQIAGIPPGSENWTQQGKWHWNNNNGKFTEIVSENTHDYTVSGNNVHFEDVKTDDHDYIFDESNVNLSDIFVNNLFKNNIYIDPRYYGFYISESPIEQVISSAQSHEDLGIEALYGANCRKIKCIYNNGVTILWIDTQHGYITRKIEVFIFQEDALFLVNTQEIDSIQQIQGVWWPTHSVIRHWNGAGDLQAEQTATLAPLPPGM
jgi:hypothetical protein